MQATGPFVLGVIWAVATIAALGVVVARLRPRIEKERPQRTPIEHPLRRAPTTQEPGNVK